MGNYMTKHSATSHSISAQNEISNSKPRNHWKAMSDLCTESKIPLHLHYKSSEATEENFFTADSRNPCLVHLHQEAKNGFELKRYDTPLSPISSLQSSFVEEVNENMQSTPATGRSFSCRSSALVEVKNSDTNMPSKLDHVSHLSSLPTPEEKMKLESAQHKTEVVSVDTSGNQFKRRVVLRRSQRSSVSSVRRKSQLKYRSRIGTDSAQPPRSGQYYDTRTPKGIARPSSVMSDDNFSTSSFFVDTSVCSDPSTSQQNTELQAKNNHVSSTKPRRNVKQRYSMPLPTRDDSTPTRAHVSLNLQNTELENQTHQNPTPKPHNNESQTEDRISSGFWSGTESCRHSTTSEILIQHHNVTQALQQILAKHPPPASKTLENTDDSSNVSTVSLNSHLSTFHQSPNSSILSLDFSTPVEDRNWSPDAVFLSSGRSQFTPRGFSTPPGGYSYMNPGYIDHVSRLSHLPSPMDLIQLGTRPSSSRSGQSDVRAPNSFESSQNRKVLEKKQTRGLQKLPFVSQTSRSPSSSNSSTSAPTPVRVQSPSFQGQFFGADFRISAQTTPSESIAKVSTLVHAGTHSDSKSRMLNRSLKQKTASKPPLPRRSSSLKTHKNATNPAISSMSHSSKEPLVKVTTKSLVSKMESHYQIPRSPPARKTDDDFSPANQTNISSSSKAGTATILSQSQCPQKGGTPNCNSQISNPNTSADCTPDLLKGAVKFSTSTALSTSLETSHIPTSVTYAQSDLGPTSTIAPHPVLLGSQSHLKAFPNKEALAIPNSSPPLQLNKNLATTRRLSAPESSIAKMYRRPSDRPPTPKRHSSLGSSTKPTRLFDPTPVNILLPETVAGRKNISDTDLPNMANHKSVALPSSTYNDGDLPFTTSALLKKSVFLRDTKECNATPKVSPYSIAPIISKPAVDSYGERVNDKISLYSNVDSSVVPAPNLPSLPNSELAALSTSTIVSKADPSSVTLSKPKPAVTPSKPTSDVTFASTISDSSSKSSFPKATLHSTVVTPPIMTSSSVSLTKDSSAILTSSATDPPAKNTLSKVTSPISAVTTSSSKAQTKKPVLRPKPFSVSRPRSDSDNRGPIDSKNDDIKRRTASARAAFFGFPNSLTLNESKPNETHFSASEKPVENKTTEPLRSPQIANSSGEISGRSDAQTASSKPVEISSNEIEIDETDIDEVELQPRDVKISEISSIFVTTNSKPRELKHAACSNVPKTMFEPQKMAACSANKQEAIPDCNTPASKALKENDTFVSADVDKLNDVIQIVSKTNSRPDLSTSSKLPSASITSTSSLPNNSNSNNSSVSRENFKALLLQNLSRSACGSHMSATEKLQKRSHNLSRSSTSNLENNTHGKSDRQRIVSMGDIRAALGSARTGRKSNHHSDHRKYPSSLVNGRRHSSRGLLSSRPMLSISEDAESHGSI